MARIVDNGFVCTQQNNVVLSAGNYFALNYDFINDFMSFKHGLYTI